MERYSSLECDTPEMTEEVRTPVALKVHQHLIHRSDGTINFDLQTARLLPGPPYPANIANVGAPPPGIRLCVNREDGRKRTSYYDADLRRLHESGVTGANQAPVVKTYTRSLGEDSEV